MRVLASVVDLVATDHDPVADEPAVQRAVQAAASALVGLAEADPERTSDALDALDDVVAAIAGGDATFAVEHWHQVVASLQPALATAHDVVGRLEAMMAGLDRLARSTGVPGAPPSMPYGPWLHGPGVAPLVDDLAAWGPRRFPIPGTPPHLRPAPPLPADGEPSDMPAADLVGERLRRLVNSTDDDPRDAEPPSPSAPTGPEASPTRHPPDPGTTAS